MYLALNSQPFDELNQVGTVHIHTSGRLMPIAATFIKHLLNELPKEDIYCS